MRGDRSSDHRWFLAGDPRRADRADELGDARLGEPRRAELAVEARGLGRRTDHADKGEAILAYPFGGRSYRIAKSRKVTRDAVDPPFPTIGVPDRGVAARSV